MALLQHNDVTEAPEAQGRTWYVWAALLAAVPFSAASVGRGSVIALYLFEFCAALGNAGWWPDVLWVLSILGELFAGALAFFGCYLACEQHGSRQEPRAADFAMGALWPAAFSGLSCLMSVNGNSSSPLLIPLSAGLVLLVGAKLRSYTSPSKQQFLLLLSGALTFLVFKAFALDDPVYFFSGVRPLWQWWVVFACTVGAMLVCGSRVLGGTRRKAAAVNSLMPPEDESSAQEAALAQALAHLKATFKVPEREFEVLRGIAQGLTTREIAARMGITSSGVSSHRSHLYEKLGVSSAQEAKRLVEERAKKCATCAHPDANALDANAAPRPRRPIHAHAAYALFILMIVTPFLINPVAEITLFGVRLSNRNLVIPWFAAVVFILLSSVQRFGQAARSNSPSASNTDIVPIATCMLAMFAVGQLFGGWVAMADMAYLILTPVCLVLCAATVGLTSFPPIGSAPLSARILATFCGGIRYLTERTPNCSLCMGASLVLMPLCSLVLSPQMPLASTFVSIAASLLCAQRSLTPKATDVIPVSDEELAVSHLMSLGLGRLYAQIAYGLAMGLETKVICERYHTSPSTVKSYWSRIKKRLNVNTPEDLRSILPVKRLPQSR